MDIAAVALATGMTIAMPVSPLDLFRFGLLAAGAIVHREAVRPIDNQNAQATGHGSLTNLTSLWIFAAALSVPLPLVFAITALVCLHAGYRSGQARLYRALFAGASAAIASAAAVALLRLVQAAAGYPIIPHGLPGLLLLIGAATVYWLVNAVLVIGALTLSNPLQRPRRVLGDLSEQVVVAASLGLAIALAVMLAWEPWLIAVLM
ncbi:MAG TPA: GGDEF domain-containing protein, partial [Pseudonocardiaceae bacterium]|nr:GGDEF domain-containing protein [Pseudonocardiaceae bacterium]